VRQQSTPHETCRRYLEQIALLALEVSRRTDLLPLFVAIIELVPHTILELARADERRLAA
jgi:hypothetical protein